jgi:hypothetical protein
VSPRKGALWRLLPLFLLTAPLRAQTDYGGSSEAFSFLNKGAGARPAALASAFEAIAEGAWASLFNPAGLGFAEAWSLGLNHDAWLASSSRENLSLAASLGAWGGASLDAAYISYPSLDLRDGQGTKTGEFSPQDEALGLAWGKAVSRNFSLGLALRGLRESLPGYDYLGYSFSAGTLWKPAEGLGLAAVLRGLPQAGLAGQSATPLLRYALSASYLLRHFLGGPLQAGLSVQLDPQAPAQLEFGLEKGFAAVPGLALRAGYASAFPAVSLGPTHGLSLGAGLRMGGLDLDYAYLPFGAFGGAQQFGLSWNFWSPKVNPLSVPAAPAPAPAAPAAGEPLAVTAPEQAPAPPPQFSSVGLEYRILSDGYVKAQGLERDGKDLAAVEAYVRALGEDAKDLPSWRALGALYQKLGKADWAAHCLAEAEKIEAENRRQP